MVDTDVQQYKCDKSLDDLTIVPTTGIVDSGIKYLTEWTESTDFSYFKLADFLHNSIYFNEDMLFINASQSSLYVSIVLATILYYKSLRERRFLIKLAV